MTVTTSRSVTDGSVTPSSSRDVTGTVTALAAVTGVRDLVGDVIEPGAFAGVDPRRVRMHARHRWADEVGDVTGAVELLPGDPRLPARTADGRPWPARAGGLWIKGRFRLDTPAGAATYREAKALAGRGRWSIGYVAGGPRREGGTRYLPRVNLIEVSLVDVPANPLAATLEVKSGWPAGRPARIEAKAAPWSAPLAGGEPGLFDGLGVLDSFDVDRARRHGLDDGETALITGGEQLRARLLALGVANEPGVADTLALFEQLGAADQRAVLGRMEREADEDAEMEQAAIVEEIATAARANRLRAASLTGEAPESWSDVLAADRVWRMDAYGGLIGRDEVGDGWSAQPPRWP